MRVLVTGGRKYNDWLHLSEVMNYLHIRLCFRVVIHGRATGTDTMVGRWAKRHDIEVEEYPADWKNISHPDARPQHNQYGWYDSKAGTRRNQQMIDEGRPDLVVSFPGGSGTADMVRRAAEAGIRVINHARIYDEV